MGGFRGGRRENIQDKTRRREKGGAQVYKQDTRHKKGQQGNHLAFPFFFLLPPPELDLPDVLVRVLVRLRTVVRDPPPP